MAPRFGQRSGHVRVGHAVGSGERPAIRLSALPVPTTGRLGPAIHPAVQYSGNVDSIGQGSAGYQARKSGLYVEATGFGGRKAA